MNQNHEQKSLHLHKIEGISKHNATCKITARALKNDFLNYKESGGRGAKENEARGHAHFQNDKERKVIIINSDPSPISKKRRKEV